MVSVLTSSAVDCDFEPRQGQTKGYEIGICCFSTKHTVLKGERAETGWLGNRDNVSQWVYQQTVVSVNQHYENPTTGKCVGLVQSGPHHHLIEN